MKEQGHLEGLCQGSRSLLELSNVRQGQIPCIACILHEAVNAKSKFKQRPQDVGDIRTMECPLKKIGGRVGLAQE